MQKKTILIIQSISELEWSFLHNDILNEEITIATGSLDVAYELENRNAEHILLWNHITKLEIEQNWVISNDIGENWTEYSGVKYSDISLDVAKLAGRDMVMMFQAAMNSKSIYYNFFECIQHVDEVLFFDKHGPALLRTGPHPTKDAVDAIEISVLKFILDELGVCYKSLVIGCKKNLNKKNSLAKKLPSIGTIKDFFSAPPLDFENDSKQIVLIYNSLFAREEVKELKGAIQSIGCFPLCVTESSLGAHNNCTSTYSFDDFRLANQYRHIFGNKHLKFYFDALSNELSYSINLAKSFGDICKIINPKLVVFGHDAFTRERVLNKECNSLNIETASIMHAGISYDFAMLNYCLGDSKNKLVWNTWHINLLKKYLPYASLTEFHTVGSLNHLKYIVPSNRPKKYLNKKRNILLLTANITIGASTPFADPNLHLDTLNELKMQFNPDQYNVIIKSHPSFDSYNIYDSIAKECKNFKHSRDCNLEKLVDWADVAILLNYPTSASIVALLKGCPVVFINCAQYSLQLWKCTPLSGSVLNVVHMNELKCAIAEALASDLSMLQKRGTEILGYSEDPRFKLRTILKELCFRNEIKRKKNQTKKLFDVCMNNQFFVFGATGYYFQFPKSNLSDKAISCYIESLKSNIATRKINFFEILDGVTNTFKSVLCRTVRLNKFYVLIAIYSLLITKMIYHKMKPRLPLDGIY